MYRSIFEANYALELDLRIATKEITHWQYDKKRSNLISLPPTTVDATLQPHPLISHDGERLHEAIHLINYYIDCVVHGTGGSIEYVETKGAETPEWKLLEAAFASEHSDITLALVNEQDYQRPVASAWGRQPGD